MDGEMQMLAQAVAVGVDIWNAYAEAATETDPAGVKIRNHLWSG